MFLKKSIRIVSRSVKNDADSSRGIGTSAGDSRVITRLTRRVGFSRFKLQIGVIAMFKIGLLVVVGTWVSILGFTSIRNQDRISRYEESSLKAGGGFGYMTCVTLGTSCGYGTQFGTPCTPLGSNTWICNGARADRYCQNSSFYTTNSCSGSYPATCPNLSVRAVCNSIGGGVFQWQQSTTQPNPKPGCGSYQKCL